MTEPAAVGAPRVATTLWVVGWVAYLGVLQWSVARFRLPIVAVLVVVAVGLAWWQWRRSPVTPGRYAVAAALVGSALVVLVVPQFSYLPDGAATGARWLAAGTALVSALLLVLGRRGPVVAVAGLAHVALTVLAVRADPAPRIDVWVTLQQGADALGRGENVYEATWSGSPGVQDAFTYLPWTAVLLAPGRWLAGDVRWALLGWFLLGLVGLVVLARRHGPRVRWAGAAAVALLVTAPGTLTQVDQAWTEPLLFCGLVWWAVLVDRDRAWWAVIPLALACASKQHLALLAPVLLLWRPFGVTRTLATGGLAGVLILPWFLASPADMWHDTVGLLVDFHPIRFANTLYLLALNTFGVTLPFWLTGAAVLGTLAAVVLTVRRRQPPLAEVLRWLALVLLVATLVNKQGFYNQYWLAAALVAVSLALPAGQRDGPGRRDPGPSAAGVAGQGAGVSAAKPPPQSASTSSDSAASG